MQGLSQLKKLSEDVLKLGNEPKLRAERGEKPVIAVIPPDVQDVDDSEDFVLGMPEQPSEDETTEESQENSQDTSASDAELLKSAEADLAALLAGNKPGPGEPDLSGILNPVMEAGDDIPDLSAFEEPPEPPKKEEPSIADMSLDDLLSAPSEDFEEAEPVEEAQPEESQPEAAQPVDDFSFAGDAIDLNLDIPEDLSEGAPAPKPAAPKPAQEAEVESLDGDLEMAEEEPNTSSDFTASPDMGDLGAGFGDSTDLGDSGASDLGDFDLSAIDLGGTDLGADLGSGADLGGDADLSGSDTSDAGDAGEAPVPDEIPTSGDFGFDAIDTSGLDDFGGLGDMSGDAMGGAGDGMSMGGDAGSDFGVGESGGAEAAMDGGSDIGADFGAAGGEGGESDFDPASVDLSGLNLGGDDDAGGAAMDFGMGGDAGQTPEVFDTSEMDGVNFDEAPSGGGMADFNIPDTDSQLSGSSDFELDSEGAGEPDFEIDGFTGIDANPFDKNGRPKIQAEEPSEEKRKNTLTDAEYKKFKANLKYYPLNVRIAVEDMIVKNEFTDDVIFEVIDKILKKIPARQLASHLEKMLDIQLSVPRDFERRTAEEYEAYKASIQYQLKARIIPAIIIGIGIFMVGFCSVYLGLEYIVKPLRAESMYRQGYALLENDEYPQSEIMFNKALELKQKKKWFFKYAQGYRRHKQYDRAELMYKNILSRFNHDKQGGMEYVRMELDDLANYAKAEEILRREVLDYHINDIDAMLLLGDIYLEWGTEEDPSKFDLAYEQYSILMQQKNPPEVIDARMMIYNVRTDKLKEVLMYKEMFYPDEKSLTGAEWTEMSGYLMDKLYGELPPQEEYLRASIEDVHSMLIRSVKKSPESPIARYNISRYYIESGDHNKAIEGLTQTLGLFKNSTHLKKRDTYKYLNTYRLLGEQYMYNRDYILAQKSLAEGIDLFEDKFAQGGFESDKNVGLMYSDMADIDYFVSGDLVNAKRNYENSVKNKNDTPSIRYRIGYINYGDKEYEQAFNNFVIASTEKENDTNLMLALGNTLSLRDDNYASAGYYERLLDLLDLEIAKKDVMIPQVNEEDTELVDKYMKASNNLGVSQFRVARETGNSSLNGESLNNLQNSLRAWDALTRNPATMVRLGGTNLAEQNIRYIISPIPSFEPAIYTDIPRILEGEKRLE